MSHAPPRERPRSRSLKRPVVHKLVAYTPARLPSPCFFDFSTQPGAVPPATKSQPLNTSQADRRTRTTHDCRPSLDYEGVKLYPPCAVRCWGLAPVPSRPRSRALVVTRFSSLPSPFLPCRFPNSAGADLLSGFGGSASASAASAGGGDVSDMLTMSPGEPSSNGNGDGNVAGRKTAGSAAGDDWLGLGGLAGNGQAAAAPAAASANTVPAVGVDGSGSGGAAKASSGSLLDDWASDGGGAQGKGAAAGAAAVDRSQMLQQKVMRFLFYTPPRRCVCVCVCVCVCACAMLSAELSGRPESCC